MRKKITISLLALLMTAAASSAMERRDTLQVLLQDEITAEYLDTVNLERSHLINDYHMIGIQYGVSLSRMMFNPVKNETFLFQPINYGIVFTHYGKMFGYMPYFGYQIGVFYGRDGYIEVSHINNPDVVRLWKRTSGGLVLQQEIRVPEQITGYEYEVAACDRAIRAGALECPEMPHQETIRIMRQMDEIRSQFGIVFPGIE